MTGIVHGVGVGPGDPELLTLKAARLIRSADLIAYPAPEEGPSFARQIAAPHVPHGIAELAIRMNIGDGRFPKDDVYDGAAATIAKAAHLHVFTGSKAPFFLPVGDLTFGKLKNAVSSLPEYRPYATHKVVNDGV